MRTATPSFIHELPLRTTPHDAAVLEVRLDAARNLYNACPTLPLKGREFPRHDHIGQSAAGYLAAHPGGMVHFSFGSTVSLVMTTCRPSSSSWTRKPARSFPPCMTCLP